MKRRSTLSRRRKTVFLRALAATGSFPHAARIASPRSKTGGVSTFRSAAARDPQFAAEVEAARDSALGAIEQEIFRRAMGYEQPVFSHGKIVGVQKVHSDRLLLRLAARMDSAWAERQAISGEMKHSHTVEASMLTISSSDVLSLAKPDQEKLVELLEKLHESRELPAPEETTSG